MFVKVLRHFRDEQCLTPYERLKCLDGAAIVGPTGVESNQEGADGIVGLDSIAGDLRRQEAPDDRLDQLNLLLLAGEVIASGEAERFGSRGR
jgi:hypothetical protein